MDKELVPEHWKNLSIIDILGEVWMDIMGYEGLYQISNMGRVKSLARWKKVFNNQRWVETTILKINKGDYLFVRLYDTNGISKWPRIHRLVAQHFIPNPGNKREVNHKKGIKWDNRASELEWVTKSENEKHAYKLGLKCTKGEKNSMSKFTRHQVDEIRAKYKPKVYTRKMLAEEYKVGHSAIDNILEYKTYTD